MEIYILDDLLRRVAVVDQFESCIWAERWKDIGDFELVIYSTVETRNLFKVGTNLAQTDSYYMMTVEYVENKYDSEGRSLLTVRGRSAESMLQNRVAKKTMSSLTTEPKWVITNKPADICREIFKKICVDGVLSASDIIPFYTSGAFFPPSNISEPDDIITVELDPTTVYQAIKDICDAYGLGFRFIRNFDTSEIYFEIYSGNNHTSSQTSLPPVVFSPELDNLQNVTEVSSSEGYKNIAYVFAKNGTAVVYAPGADASTVGNDRRVLMVKADDIELAAGPALTAALQQRGLDELAKTRGIVAFDGEITQNGPYKYGIDYMLGDLVEIRNADGFTNQMRVTEQIFVSDIQGDRTYPTLALDLLIMPGTWLSWDAMQHWEEATGTWEDAAP